MWCGVTDIALDDWIFLRLVQFYVITFTLIHNSVGTLTFLYIFETRNFYFIKPMTGGKIISWIKSTFFWCSEKGIQISWNECVLLWYEKWKRANLNAFFLYFRYSLIFSHFINEEKIKSNSKMMDEVKYEIFSKA